MSEQTLEQKVVYLLEDKDAHFTANWVVARGILALIRSEIEKAGLIDVDSSTSMYPHAVYAGAFRQQAHILKIFEEKHGHE